MPGMAPLKPVARNPFTASFGVPNEATLVGRQAEIAYFLQGLEDLPGSTYRAISIVGPRGVGKTTLLNNMLDQARRIGWIGVAVTAGPGMAEHILDKASLAAEDLLDPGPKRRLTGISVAGFSLQTQAVSPETPSWWRRINTLLDVLEEHNSGLVIAIDEVHRDEPELRPFFQRYQELVNDGRNVSIIMAGLPDAVESVLSAYALTFIQRAYRIMLSTLDLTMVQEAYQNVFTDNGKQISDAVAALAATASEGYPYMYQLIGYHTWRSAADSDTVTKLHVTSALEPAHDLAGRNLFELEIKSLTDRELDFLNAMLEDEVVSRTVDISKRLGISQENAYYYRNRLIAHGLVRPPKRGSIAFVSEYLRSYLSAREH